jgi:AcrR family transcriptional regulator
MTRLSRKEQQARTRAELMRSASKIFCRRGLEKTSIEEVAREAGFTKGAFYANFRSKEELFMAMLDEQFAAEIERLDEALQSDEEFEDQVRSAGVDLMRFIRSGPDSPRLFFEFATYAARDPEFREEFRTRNNALRERIVELYRRRSAELEVESPVPVEQVALFTTCMANGFLIEQLLDPEIDDELYGAMTVIFFRGLGAMLEEQDPEAFERLAGQIGAPGS